MDIGVSVLYVMCMTGGGGVHCDFLTCGILTLRIPAGQTIEYRVIYDKLNC